MNKNNFSGPLLTFIAICCLFFMCHQILEKILLVRLAFIDNYLDTFVFSPLVTAGYAIEKKWMRGYPTTKLSIIEIFMIAIWLSIISEIIFPMLSDKFTQDVRDVVAIFTGSIFYIIFQNIKNKNECIVENDYF